MCSFFTNCKLFSKLPHFTFHQLPNPLLQPQLWNHLSLSWQPHSSLSQDSHHIGIKSLLGRRNTKVSFSPAKGSTIFPLLWPCFKLVLCNFWELLPGNWKINLESCNLSSTYLTFLDATLSKQWKHGDENSRNTSLMSFCSPLSSFLLPNHS